MSSMEYVMERVESTLSRMDTIDDVETIAGFPVVVGKKENPFKRGFQDSKLQLEARLSAAGIEPLAVVPSAWWDSIVSRSGLIDVDPSQKYEFRMPVGYSDRLISLRNRLSIGVGAMIGSGVLVGAYVGSFVFGASLAAPLFAAFPAIAIGAATTALAYRLVFRAEVVARIFSWRGRLVRDVLSRRRGYDSGSPVDFTFPTPPGDVVEVLKKVRDAELNVRVAAEPAAFSFSVDPVLYVASKMTDRIIELREARARAMADPIIYVRIGEAVAVLAQFGDFPIEKRVVDSVVGLERS